MSGPTFITERMFFRPPLRRFHYPSKAITREVQKCKTCHQLFFMKWQPLSCVEHEGEEVIKLEVC